MSSPYRTLLASLALAAAIATAQAHEFWLMPQRFRVAVAEAVRVTLFHGERFAGDQVPRNDQTIQRFALLGPNTSSEIVGLSGRPISYLRCEEPGPHLLVYHARGMTNLLDADRFTAYLLEEGLDDVVELRRNLAESHLPAREAYERCAKSIITAADATPADRPVGLPVEIVLDSISPASDATRVITARVLHQGLPLAGARVVAVAERAHEHLLVARTDHDGAVSFDAPSPGVWMLTTIHMERATDRSAVDWQSYWASLTFEIHDAPPAGAE